MIIFDRGAAGLLYNGFRLRYTVELYEEEKLYVKKKTIPNMVQFHSEKQCSERIKCEYTVYADTHRGGSGGGKQPLCTVYAVSVK